MRDVKNVIEQAKILFLSKNDGEVLQEFLWAAGHSAVQEAKNTHAPSDRESVKSDTKGAMEGLKTLGNLLITNGEFRKLREQTQLRTLILQCIVLTICSE